ncbi:unnamed protein product [Lymnaea stagnalis]|uniref:SURF1-like protein n=1 Tax=Lymnaea stagnalis TaxID=6523 RepID=A0AAV2HKE0_LYMST
MSLNTKTLKVFSKLNENWQKIKLCIRFKSQTEIPKRQVPREKPAVRKQSSSGYPLLMVPLAAFGLGTWQIQRREWKLNLIKELEEKMQAPTISLPQNIEDLKDLEYRKVKVRGTFDHSREVFIGPRSNLHAPDTMGGKNKSSTIGVHVVTPFKLSDRDETILVNRGHVPFANRPQEMRSEGQIEGEVEITGVIRLNDKKSFMDSDPLKDGFWLTRNIDEMADIVGTSKIFIDADFSSTVPGGPTGGQTKVTLRNEHLTYIITWYSLAALTLFMWVKVYRRPTVHKRLLEALKQEHGKL